MRKITTIDVCVVLPCALCGRKPRALSGRELHCLDCIKRIEDEEASL